MVDAHLAVLFQSCHGEANASSFPHPLNHSAAHLELCNRPGSWGTSVSVFMRKTLPPAVARSLSQRNNLKLP